MKKLPALLLTFFLCLTACGYHVAGDSNYNVIPENNRKMALGEIDNPSVETWLVPELHTQIREELTRRGLVTWTDRKKAQSVLNITILRFTDGADVTGAEDKTKRYSSSLTLRAELVDRVSGNIIWRSGDVSASQSWFTGGKMDANVETVRQITRRIAARLQEQY